MWGETVGRGGRVGAVRQVGRSGMGQEGRAEAGASGGNRVVGRVEAVVVGGRSAGGRGKGQDDYQ